MILIEAEPRQSAQWDERKFNNYVTLFRLIDMNDIMTLVKGYFDGSLVDVHIWPAFYQVVVQDAKDKGVRFDAPSGPVLVSSISVPSEAQAFASPPQPPVLAFDLEVSGALAPVAPPESLLLCSVSVPSEAQAFASPPQQPVLGFFLEELSGALAFSSPPPQPMPLVLSVVPLEYHSVDPVWGGLCALPKSFFNSGWESFFNSGWADPPAFQSLWWADPPPFLAFAKFLVVFNCCAQACFLEALDGWPICLLQ
jgi:hypothetical protein